MGGAAAEPGRRVWCDVVALEAGGGAAELDVRKGDEGTAERHVAMDRCTRISIIQASVLEALHSDPEHAFDLR